MAVALTGVDLFWLGWFATVPLLLGLFSLKTPARAILPAAITGVAWALGLWFWLPSTVQHMSGGRFTGIPFLLALCLLWALMIVTFAVLLVWQKNRLEQCLRPTPARWISLATIPFLWVTLDYTLSRLMTSLCLLFYPCLGLTQWNHPVLLQAAALAGLPGLTFVLLLFSALVTLSIAKRRLSLFLIAAGIPVLCVAGGAIRLVLKGGPPDAPPVRVSIMQGNIKPSWQPGKAASRALAHRYLELGREANEGNPDLVLWSETAIPWVLEPDDDLMGLMLGTVTRSAGCTHLVGTMSKASPAGGASGNRNTIYEIMPNGDVKEAYYKVNLIPLVERPVRLPFASGPLDFYSQGGALDLQPGNGPVLFSSRVGVIGPVVCNEILYPDYLRSVVLRGADFIVTPANGGWLTCDTPRRQQFFNTIFRAVETGRDIVVANNSGISGIIDAFGRVQIKTQTRQPQVATGTIHRRNRATFYLRHGDWFAYVCIWSSLGLLIFTAIAPRMHFRMHSSRPARQKRKTAR